MFNVSACVWNEGAKENIITIASTDSDSATNGGSRSSSKSHLSGGAIAGIVVACVIAGILLAVAITYIILRKRRKWLKTGFAVVAKDPEPDESVLRGPVFNSEPQSTADNSTPMSAADISAPRSTAECSRSAADSPARPATIGENSAGSYLPELDGRDTLIKPKTELDGRGIQLHRLDAGPIQQVTDNLGLYELPGDEVAGAKNKVPEPDQVSLPSTEPDRELSPRDKREGESNATLGPIGQEERAGFHVVSPTTPTHNGARPF